MLLSDYLSNTAPLEDTKHAGERANRLSFPRRLMTLITVTEPMSAATTHQHLQGKGWSTNAVTRLALSISAVLCLSALVDCSGGGSGDSVTLTATITGLDPSTRYYFAVSAYNGLSGPCSNEVSTVTPPSGAVSLAWDSVNNPTVSAYDVHYGKESPGQPGDCTYSDAMQVPAPS
jgi:hypothetical protein